MVSRRAGQELPVGGMLDAVTHRGKGCCGFREITLVAHRKDA